MHIRKFDFTSRWNYHRIKRSLLVKDNFSHHRSISMSQLVIDNIDLVPASCLEEEDEARWADYHSEHALQYGVTLHPSFTRAVSMAKAGVDVVRLHHAGTTVGYMPVSRDSRGWGHPSGRWLMSFQGIVGDRRYRVCPVELLAKAGLKRIVFDRCVDAYQSFSKQTLFSAESPVIDLRHGYRQYQQDLRNRGSHLMKRMEQRRRRAEREFGSVNLIDATNDQSMLDRLISWRRQRNRQILALDFLKYDWTQNCLAKLNQAATGDFRGRLLELNVGNQPAAALFAVQHQNQLECVITAFDPQMAPASPGLLLFHLLARDASQFGVDFIHLTRGVESFKERFGNASVPVSDVVLGQSTLAQYATRWAYQAEEWIRGTRLNRPAQRVYRLANRWREWLVDDANKGPPCRENKRSQMVDAPGR